MMEIRRFFWFLPSVIVVFSMLFSCGSDETDNKPEIEPNKIYGVRSYKREFNDLNPKHLSAARKIGIKPVFAREDLSPDSRELLRIGSNDYYNVDRLTHSIPYLVPQASGLLMAIAMNFQDSLASKGMDKYKLIVTSVLRTKADVKRLRKRNSNASENSAHFYGTTFDICYNRFDKVGEDGVDEEVRELKPKLVLSEVLRDLKKAGFCYVKYEVKQGCFHITAR